MQSEGALCNRCNCLVEKFDDLQSQSREVQKKLIGRLQHLQQTQSELIFIKQEPEEWVSDNEISKSDECAEDEPLKSDESVTYDEYEDDDDEDFTNNDAVDEDLIKKDSYCEECSKSFKNARCLQMHYILHSKPRSILCAR